MLETLTAVVLLAVGAGGADPAAPAPAAPAASPSALPAQPPGADPPKSPLQTAQDNWRRAQQLYEESCQNRAYGAYDDLCDQLSRQVRQFRVELDRQERAARP